MTPFRWLSIRRTPVWNGYLELVPAFLYSLYLTFYKAHTSVKRTPRVGTCLHDSLYLTLYKTDITRGQTIRAGPKERELTVQPNGVFQNSPLWSAFFKKMRFPWPRLPDTCIRYVKRERKNLHFQKKTFAWTGPMFADIISVYNGYIKRMGRGLIPLALECALQSFPVHL